MVAEDQVYDRIRREWVAATPEELVRQALLRRMVEQLGYPPSLIVVEKALRQLPNVQLSGVSVPDRRADLICFSRGIHPDFSLYPLLMVECKAVPLTSRVENQVVGYNDFVKAYYVAVANAEAARTGWRDVESGEYRFVDGLPSYRDLLAATQSYEL